MFWSLNTIWNSCLCVHVYSVVPDSLWPHGLQSTRILCPWDFPGKNTGVGCHFLLQWSSCWLLNRSFENSENLLNLTLLMMMPLISNTDISIFLHSFPSQIIALTRSEAGLELWSQNKWFWKEKINISIHSFFPPLEFFPCVWLPGHIRQCSAWSFCSLSHKAHHSNYHLHNAGFWSFLLTSQFLIWRERLYVFCDDGR